MGYRTDTAPLTGRATRFPQTERACARIQHTQRTSHIASWVAWISPAEKPSALSAVIIALVAMPPSVEAAAVLCAGAAFFFLLFFFFFFFLPAPPAAALLYAPSSSDMSPKS